MLKIIPETPQQNQLEQCCWNNEQDLEWKGKEDENSCRVTQDIMGINSEHNRIPH